MNQPPPPLPTRSSYQSPIPPPAGSSVGLIVSGAAITLGGQLGVLFVAMALLTLLHIDNIFAFVAINAGMSLAIGVPLALWLRKGPRGRGWTIGIFIGLGIGLAFWLVAAAFIGILVLGTPSNR